MKNIIDKYILLYFVVILVFLNIGNRRIPYSKLVMLIGGNSGGNTDSVVFSIKNGVEFSHEHVTDEEHFLGDVHGHDGGGTGGNWITTSVSFS